MSETAIAFARLCLCGVETTVTFVGASRASTETGVAFARAGRAPIETAVAFAVEKWVFLAWFSVAEVMVVSMVAVWGRAVVMAVSMVAVQGRAVVMVVSCWPASVAAEVSLVAKSPRAGSRARKSSPSARKMAQNRRLVACWARLFAETPLEGLCRASFFAIQQLWDPTGRVVLCRGPGRRPFGWQC